MARKRIKSPERTVTEARGPSHTQARSSHGNLRHGPRKDPGQASGKICDEAREIRRSTAPSGRSKKYYGDKTKSFAAERRRRETRVGNGERNGKVRFGDSRAKSTQQDPKQIFPSMFKQDYNRIYGGYRPHSLILNENKICFCHTPTLENTK
jgi:hypothetical protein